MQVHKGYNNLPSIKNPVVTVGSFDGVHLGHKVIIDRLNNIAKKINGESVLISFYPHPRKVLYPDTIGKELNLINSQKEKILQLDKAGLNHLIIIEFTKEFSQITSQKFVEEILLQKIHASSIIVGFNHHFGHNREGDYSYLYNLAKNRNFKVEEIPEQDLENETVSSTIIRKALKEGRIQRANAYLDHLFICIGKLLEGSAECRKIGFPTLKFNIEEDVKLIPFPGVYAISLEYENKRFRGMMSDKLPNNF
jgi:riboflavin kinase/FMN adenylyltransferase